ncbi:hypothetical protein AnigIFM50267_003535 [Aspergillus niger]|nr:hypothetical protein AnigIFM50267_003535 [Aspergillus niger]
MKPPSSIRHDTEIFMSQSQNFASQEHAWLKNRRDILHFLLQEEENFSNTSIQDVFERSIFETRFWKLFSSSFGLHPSHSALEFHRYICKYMDEIVESRVTDRLHPVLDKSFANQLKPHLSARGVRFRDIRVTDIIFQLEGESSAVCYIQASDKFGNVLLPVATEDIVIVTIGSLTSGTVTGTTAAPPPATPSKAESLLDNTWRLWFALAKKSQRFGNPSSFCTRLSESRLGMFTVNLSSRHHTQIRARSMEAYAGGHDIAIISESAWSLQVSFPGQLDFADGGRGICSVIGYCFTPDRLGHYVKNPMFTCSGDEVLAELLGYLDIPGDDILLNATTRPIILPLGLSPLMRRDCGDRPEIIPRQTRNIALIGQYVEMAEETALTMDYGTRSALTAVKQLVGPRLYLTEVQKSFLSARYGHRSTGVNDLCDLETSDNNRKQSSSL